MNLLDRLTWSKGPGHGPKLGDDLDSGRAGWHLLDLGPESNPLEVGSWFLAMGLIAFGLFILLLIVVGG
jgi:hypothetical protein